MLILRCSSSASSVHELLGLGENLGSLLFLSPKAVRTAKELEFAFYLAKESFKEGSNVSKKLSNEAMLFLANETNFSSAARKVGTASVDDFVLVSEEKIPVAKLKKKLLLTRAASLALSGWGKKMGDYFEAELAIERMALARIRN